MNDTEDRTTHAVEAQACFDSADNIVDARDGYDPEADVPHIIAAQVQATIGVGHAILAVAELLGDISGHLDAIAANIYHPEQDPAW